MSCLSLAELIPLSNESLKLLQWKDNEGYEHSFSLVNQVGMRWRTTGLCLGLVKSHLQELDKETRNKYCNNESPNFSWSRIMGQWMDRGGTSDYPASWNGVDKLLRDIGHTRDAEELRRALLLATAWTISRNTFLGFVREKKFLLSVIALAVSAVVAYIMRR
jgi:hypothetical protein